MLRDVFYFGEKPNVHPRERQVFDIDEARKEATTEHFWIINEFCDYTGFDCRGGMKLYISSKLKTLVKMAMDDKNRTKYLDFTKHK